MKMAEMVGFLTVFKSLASTSFATPAWLLDQRLERIRQVDVLQDFRRVLQFGFW